MSSVVDPGNVVVIVPDQDTLHEDEHIVLYKHSAPW
jgi:hypothetical protein